MCFMKKLFCILLLASNFAHGEASLPALTAEQWRQDLEFFANEITTKHRDPFHFISKAEFDQAVSNLRQRIPSMKDYEVVAGLQHLAALIGDGHTFLDTSGLYQRFPLEGFWFGNDLRVIRAALNTGKRWEPELSRSDPYPSGKSRRGFNSLFRKLRISGMC